MCFNLFLLLLFNAACQWIILFFSLYFKPGIDDLTIINVISDDVYFLQGVRYLLTDAMKNQTILYNDINKTDLRNIVDAFTGSVQKVIVYIHSIRKRRVMLRLLAAYNLQVYVITQCNVAGCNYVHGPVMIPVHFPLKDFVQKIKPDIKNRRRKHSLKSKKIFKGLSAGMSIKDLAERMNISPKAVYAIKNNTMRRFGIKTTKMYGVLLCRDLLEMNDIRMRYKPFLPRTLRQ